MHIIYKAKLFLFISVLLCMCKNKDQIVMTEMDIEKTLASDRSILRVEQTVGENNYASLFSYLNDYQQVATPDKLVGKSYLIKNNKIYTRDLYLIKKYQNIRAHIANYEALTDTTDGFFGIIKLKKKNGEIIECLTHKKFVFAGKFKEGFSFDEGLLKKIDEVLPYDNQNSGCWPYEKNSKYMKMSGEELLTRYFIKRKRANKWFHAEACFSIYREKGYSCEGWDLIPEDDRENIIYALISKGFFVLRQVVIIVDLPTPYINIDDQLDLLMIKDGEFLPKNNNSLQKNYPDDKPLKKPAGN